ncbi:hypothetical protein NFI96_005619, partial [Prochilodus magdalenae]
MTVLIEVEGIINSKPLGYASSDISDPDPITPNLLLMGRQDPATPQVVYSETELLSRRRWRQCRVLADQFWAKFIRDYLLSLQTRSKWQQEKEDLIVGSIATIIDPQLPRALWLVGYITAVIPGADGRMRTAQIQTAVSSHLFYAVVCWGGSIKKRDEMRLDRLVRPAGSVVGVELDSVVKVAERRTPTDGHPLHTIIMDKR